MNQTDSLFSGSSTIAHAPEELTDDSIFQDNENIFALFRPMNSSAQTQFSQSVNFINDPYGNSDFEQYRHFMHIEPSATGSPSAVTEEEDEDKDDGQVPIYSPSVSTEDEDEDKDADVDEPHTNPALPRLNGFFKLSLRTPPKNPHLGWCIGSSQGHPNDIDVLIAPPGKVVFQESGISGLHIQLYLHRDSCRLVLEARHTVTIKPSSRTTIHHSQSQVLSHMNHVLIGNCLYCVEYTTHFQSVVFQAEFSRYMKQLSGPTWTMHHSLIPASVGLAVHLGTRGEYYCSPNAFAAGTFGRVKAGWTNEGATVAVKAFKKPEKTEIEIHKIIMRIIGKHENVVELLDCSATFEANPPTAYCVYSPLALLTLRELIESYKYNSAAKVILFRDFLRGLSYLHGKGIMHRDIKPENLAIRSVEDPTGIILDLDGATTDEYSMDHWTGTTAYLAPEIMALKAKDASYHTTQVAEAYDKSVDIWALGLTMYAVLKCHQWSWSHFRAKGPTDRYSEKRWNIFFQKVEELQVKALDPIDGRLAEIIADMIAIDPPFRLLASSALKEMEIVATEIDIDVIIVPMQGEKHAMDDESEAEYGKRRHLE